MSVDSSFASNRLLLGVGIGIGVTMISSLGYLYLKYIRRDNIPEKWQRIGTLEHIYLFPIKSCAPLKLNAEVEIPCEILGFCLDGIRDRGLMLIDDNNQMITARVYPKMVRIQPEIIGPKRLQITYEDVEPLELDLGEIGELGPGKDVHTAVWDTKLDAMLCGDKYDKWFSKVILNKENGLRLVYYPYPKPVRSINPRMKREPHIISEDTGAFPDATSYTLMNLASVDELNTRVPRSVHPLQFRGNFYVKMDKPVPYAEDKWQWVRIGNDKVFRVISPCTRCIFPNINVFTGERDPDGQPSKALKSYRIWPKYPSPVFGIHLGLRQPGNPVKLHDVVYIEDN